MDQTIIDAIENKFLLQFYYDGNERIVEPHCYGQTLKGNDAVRAFQVGGDSSRETTGWKLFDLSKASSLVSLNETFEFPRPGYKKGDTGMSIIYVEL